MTKENTLVVNPLPSPTWNRLHMNETTVTLPPLDGPCKADGAARKSPPPRPRHSGSTRLGPRSGSGLCLPGDGPDHRQSEYPHHRPADPVR